ncbi:MAG TPA: class I SAM-dependent methyltransferase [Acidimicrobiales bacterium]
MAGGGDLYERIGRSYSSTRREDPRIAAHILEALGDAATIVNVGAGTGNYEPADRRVVAVEPSGEMIRQRTGRSREVVRARAEALPFGAGAFDAGLAVLTVHHWTDRSAGLRELRRVARRQVVFYFEPLHAHGFWALEYFPEATSVPSERDAPGEDLLREHLRVCEVRTVPVPADCSDGFGAAFWARPEAYADPSVQAGMSWLALLPPAVRARGTARLLSDLASGEWDRRHGHLRRLTEIDGGYRIAIAGR